MTNQAKGIIRMNGGELAEWLHNTYEALAEVKEWKTQKSTQVSFDNLPEKNKSVMLGLAQCIQINLGADLASGLIITKEEHEQKLQEQAKEYNKTTIKISEIEGLWEEFNNQDKFLEFICFVESKKIKKYGVKEEGGK